MASLWPLLHTWTCAVCQLPADSPAVAGWWESCEQLQVVNPVFTDRVVALDAYLDTVEETLEEWAHQQGV